MLWGFLPGAGSCGSAALEALPAKYGPSLSRSKGYRCFTSALGTNSGSFYSSRRSAPIRRIVLAFHLARFAAFGFVFEILLVVKLLLACGKYEIRTAVRTLQHPILKFQHGTILEA
jgi:hypothetical protein